MWLYNKSQQFQSILAFFEIVRTISMLCLNVLDKTGHGIMVLCDKRHFFSQKCVVKPKEIHSPQALKHLLNSNYIFLNVILAIYIFYIDLYF